MRVIIIGGGWAGCSAAVTARNAGAEVHIFEKTDMLVGLGNVGGIMRNNGRYTGAEELIALGASDLLNITDSNTLHKSMDFPGHDHAWLYDVNKIEPEVRRHLIEIGVNLHTISRVVDVEKSEDIIKGIYTSDGSYFEADTFVETTGSTGPMGNCLKYGNGCSMCILRCPAFGPRISISYKAGIEDLQGEREDGIPGAFSGSCEIARDSLSSELVDRLSKEGLAVLQVPIEDINREKLKLKVCQQYALEEYAKNIILLDTGHIKLMTPFYPLEKLRKIPGLENARYVDPYAGGKGNSIRYLSVAPRDNALRVRGLKNLFCAGEKSGLFVGHTEAMCTGALAGYNSVRSALGLKLIELPRETAIGDLIAYANEKMETVEGRRNRYTFAGADYFKRMKDKNLYSLDKAEIKKRIQNNDLDGILKRRLL